MGPNKNGCLDLKHIPTIYNTCKYIIEIYYRYKTDLLYSIIGIVINIDFYHNIPIKYYAIIFFYFLCELFFSTNFETIYCVPFKNNNQSTYCIETEVTTNFCSVFFFS